MKKYEKITIVSFSALIMFTSCSRLTLLTKPFDFLTIHQRGNLFYLPSMHSAIKIDILEQKVVGDTLEIKYQAGTSREIKSDELINFSNDIKFIKCQNINNRDSSFQLYEVVFNEGHYEIDLIGNITL